MCRWTNKYTSFILGLGYFCGDMKSFMKTATVKPLTCLRKDIAKGATMPKSSSVLVNQTLSLANLALSPWQTVTIQSRPIMMLPASLASFEITSIRHWKWRTVITSWYRFFLSPWALLPHRSVRQVIATPCWWAKNGYVDKIWKIEIFNLQSLEEINSYNI